MKNNIESLINDFTCDDVTKCQIARRSLVDMGSSAVDALVKELSNKKHWVRWESAKALGQIGDRNAVKALVVALEDNEFDVRWLAAEALINIGKDSLEPLLAALVDHGGESLILRQGVHHVLHDMDRGDLDEILKPLMSAVEDTALPVEVPLAAKKVLDVLRTR
jgi:HEAT repeat protein